MPADVAFHLTDVAPTSAFQDGGRPQGCRPRRTGEDVRRGVPCADDEFAHGTLTVELPAESVVVLALE